MSANRCAACGADNRPGARFCTKCGAALPGAEPESRAVCPRCGVPTRPGARFCPGCGVALMGESSASQQEVAEERRVVVRWPGGQTDEQPLVRPVVTVGRAPDNEIVLSFPTVSGHHLRLDVAPDEVLITDLNSTNGTMLKGRLVAPGVPQLWRPGEIVRVGDLRGNSISMVLQGTEVPTLHTYPLGMHRLARYTRIIIGRDPSSQITLDHPTVSRHHAEVVRQQGERQEGERQEGERQEGVRQDGVRQDSGHAIRDLGSVNGTFVNGERVTDWTPLRMGDVIQLGPYRMVYDGQAERLSTSVSRGHRLDAMGLGVEVAGGKMILQDVSLSVQGSEFAALVGGSGAGKSTLIKAMNGFRPATHGRMLIDGEPLYPNLATYRTLMGYVPQDDIIHKTLPVRTALWYSARLRLPDATAVEINARIDDVLEMVELTAHQNKPVSVLSGGQRKRVSIAVELLAEPALLFLDEPTSGLDPGLEKKMMYDLNRLADQGRTVVLVTHATANIEQCDHVGFLERGNLAYYGPPKDAIPFFQAQDFADIYLKLSEEVEADGSSLPADLKPYHAAVKARMAPEDRSSAPFSAGVLWAEHYRTSEIYKQYVGDRQASVDLEDQPSQSVQPARPKQVRDSIFRQLFILARRQFDLIRNDVRTLFILLLMMPLIGMLFMLVSEPNALVGRRLLTSQAESGEALETAMTAELLSSLGLSDEEELRGVHVDEMVSYVPLADASNLVVMLGLALTQAGTFGAAYEIVKERAIFRREKSVNLMVGAYVLSKALVLGAFAVVQVASVLILLSLKLDLGFDPIFDIFPNGGVELFATLLIAVFASIMFGLFISAVVPSQDVVLYVILVQLFAQIILSGTMFPLDANPAQKLVISYWTMDAMGATVDLNKMNEDALICRVWEQEVPVPSGQQVTQEVQRGIGCETPTLQDLGLPYEHSKTHLGMVWGVLAIQALVWGTATMVVQSNVKGD